VSKKRQFSGDYLRACECQAPDRRQLYLSSIPVEWPPILLSTLQANEWEQRFTAKANRVPVDFIDHNFAQISNMFCHGDVPLSQEASRAIQFYQNTIRSIQFLAAALSRWHEYEVFPLEGHTVLVPRLSPDAATNIAIISEVLSKKSMTRTLAGIKRVSKPRKTTPKLITETAQLFHRLHDRLRKARKDYTRHKNSSAWSKHVALDDRKRPGQPKIPSDLISQLPFKSPRDLALEWTAQKLNHRHDNLGATSNTVRSLLKTATKADTPQ
jgi:hypothetical protein